MPSNREQFFQRQSFAVIGNSKLKPFPRLTYGGLRKMGKTVYAVDLSGADSVGKHKAFGSLAELPEPVQGAIVEVPRNATLDAVRQAAEAGIKDVWLHMRSDSPEVLELCRREGINVRWGTCAVMYTGRGSYHAVHRGISKLLRKY
jgi:predicted CoA-binding protein